MNYMKFVIPLHSLYWSIHTKDESKRGTAFAFIIGVNWLWCCGVTASFGVFFHGIHTLLFSSLCDFWTLWPDQAFIVSNSSHYKDKFKLSYRWGPFLTLCGVAPGFCSPWKTRKTYQYKFIIYMQVITKTSNNTQHFAQVI